MMLEVAREIHQVDQFEKEFFFPGPGIWVIKGKETWSSQGVWEGHRLSTYKPVSNKVYWSTNSVQPTQYSECFWILI